MTEEVASPAVHVRKSWVTSERLSWRAVVACWVLALGLLCSGITATFMSKPGAAAASMVALGGLLMLVALMQRIPLRLEVAGAKFDASYPQDRAFDAGREGGVLEGLETAIEEAEQTEAAGADVDALLIRLRQVREQELPTPELLPTQVDGGESGSELRAPGGLRFGYRGPTACHAAGITYRQLDYWARTGLVLPTGAPLNLGAALLFTVEDIVNLAVAKRLLDAGVSLQQIRIVLPRLRDLPEAIWDQVTLMSDGRSVWEAKSADEVIELVDSGRGVFGISVGRVKRAVQQSLRGVPGELIQ